MRRKTKLQMWNSPKLGHRWLTLFVHPLLEIKWLTSKEQRLGFMIHISTLCWLGQFSNIYILPFSSHLHSFYTSISFKGHGSIWSLYLKPDPAVISHGVWVPTHQPTCSIRDSPAPWYFHVFSFANLIMKSGIFFILKMWISPITMNTEDFFTCILWPLKTAFLCGNCLSVFFPIFLWVCLFVRILTNLIPFLSQVPGSADHHLFHAMLYSHLYLSQCLIISYPTPLFPQNLTPRRQYSGYPSLTPLSPR